MALPVVLVELELVLQVQAVEVAPVVARVVVTGMCVIQMDALQAMVEAVLMEERGPIMHLVTDLQYP